MLYIASMGETGLSHDIFLKFSVRPFEVVIWWNFEAATSKVCNCSWKFGSSPRKGKVDLCMTNGLKVLIYWTLLYFLLQYLQEYSKIWNIAKSNKSELWNRLSYRGLPYLFEVRRQKFRNDCQISRSQPQKFDLDFHSTSTTSKGPTENSKKMSWDNPVSPIDAKNSIRFLCHFFGLAWTTRW